MGAAAFSANTVSQNEMTLSSDNMHIDIDSDVLGCALMICSTVLRSCKPYVQRNFMRSFVAGQTVPQSSFANPQWGEGLDLRQQMLCWAILTLSPPDSRGKRQPRSM